MVKLFGQTGFTKIPSPERRGKGLGDWAKKGPHVMTVKRLSSGRRGVRTGKRKASTCVV